MQEKRTQDALAQAKTFASLLLPAHIEQSLREAGFRRPSPVQEAALPLARMGTDLLVQAKAGTGKTLVFAVAAVERVDLSLGMPQVLVLAPTREIALQASETMALVAAALPPPGLSCGTFIGGLPVEEDEKQLRRACHVAVGTAGRILDLIQRGSLRVGSVRLLVLDEADKLLGDGFRKDVLAICKAVPARRQTIALSATYAPAALEQLRSLMRGQQQEVRLCADDVSLLGVRQSYRLLGPSSSAAAEGSSQAGSGGSGGGKASLDARVSALLQLLSAVSFQQAVVFCKYTADAEEVAQRLLAAGYPAAYLSAQRTQLQRIEALNALREFRLRVAVSTDLAARGVDLDRVNLVVNLELPGDAATYMHRVGRAGRFGTRGLAVTLLEGEPQLDKLRGYLEEVSGGQVVELPDPIPEDWYLQTVPTGTATAAPASAGSPAASEAAASSSQASSLAAAAGMGPDTPAGTGSLLAASLAADSQGGSGGAGPLADIATASLWLVDEEEGEEGEEEQEPEQESSDSAVEISYSVVPKPTAVSSLTAAVAAAEASSRRREVGGAAAGNGSSAAGSQTDSDSDWDSSSDDDYSGSSGSETEGRPGPYTAAAAAHVLRSGGSGTGRSAEAAGGGFRPTAGLHRVGSDSSSGSGESSGSRRKSSPPAPIPGRGLSHPPEAALPAPWHNNFEEEGGGGLADAAAAAETAGLLPRSASGSEESAEAGSTGSAGACHRRLSSASGDEEEEPSFRDSWLAEGGQQAQEPPQHYHQQQQQLGGEAALAEGSAAAAVADAAPSIELRPHRRSGRSPKLTPGQAAHRSSQRPPKPHPQQQQQQGERGKQQQQEQLRQQGRQAQQAQQQGHYWQVVRSVERDVLGRLGGTSPAGQPGSGVPDAATPPPAAMAAAGNGGGIGSSEDDEGEFVPSVPRQRRPLGSAQLSATRRREDEAAASLAAEAAALEMLAGQEEDTEEEEEVGGQLVAAAASAADAEAAAAEQQRQWTEFWHAHFTYYGCYPSEGLFSAAGQPAAAGADPEVAAPAALGPYTSPSSDAAAASVAATATLPPPPSPPSPPPPLSAAAWATQQPAFAGPAVGSPTAAGAAAATAAAAATDAGDGWVTVPAGLLARYQQLEWQQWHRQQTEWQQMWEDYKQYWAQLYNQQQLEQQQLEQQQEAQAAAPPEQQPT